MTLSHSEKVISYDGISKREIISILTIEWEKVSDIFTIRLDNNGVQY